RPPADRLPMRSRLMHPSGFLRSCPGHLRSLIWKGKQPQRIQPALSILEPSFAWLSIRFDSDSACIASFGGSSCFDRSSGALVRTAPGFQAGSFLRLLLFHIPVSPHKVKSDYLSPLPASGTVRHHHPKKVFRNRHHPLALWASVNAVQDQIPVVRMFAFADVFHRSRPLNIPVLVWLD